MTQDLAKLAVDCFGNEEVAMKWWYGRCYHLHNERPSDVIKTEEGHERVRIYLWQMIYGIYV